MAQRLSGEGVMSLVRVVRLTSLLVAVVASFGSPAGAFNGRLGRAGQQRRSRQVPRLHHDGRFRKRDTLVFIISRDFAWGLALVNDKWNLVADEL